MKQCTNCRVNLADFVPFCPYCGVSQPVPQTAMAQAEWGLLPRSSNKALASLICGVPFLFVPASIAAIILGHLALADIKRSAGRIAGQGMAVAGLVMGYVGVALTAILTLAIVFTVRNTLRHNVPANEMAAIATMRIYNDALKAYAAKCPQQGFPSTLISLGPGTGTGDCTRANLTDARLAIGRPVRLGYQFVYTPGVLGAERVTVFALVARPVQPGFTGRRYFFLDEGGVIRQADSQIIGPKSEPVNEPESGTETDDTDDKAEQ